MTRRLRLLLAVFLLSGCGTMRQWVEFYNPAPHRTPDYQRMTYIQLLNLEMKLKHAKRPQKRMVFFYGKLKSTEQEAGVKFIFPF